MPGLPRHPKRAMSGLAGGAVRFQGPCQGHLLFRTSRDSRRGRADRDRASLPFTEQCGMQSTCRGQRTGGSDCKRAVAGVVAVISFGVDKKASTPWVCNVYWMCTRGAGTGRKPTAPYPEDLELVQELGGGV